MTDYFTSDLHLGHVNILHLSNRPFTSVEEMNRILISTILEILSHGDDLYLLGDLSLSEGPAELALGLFYKAGIQVHWILGGHDILSKQTQDLCVEVVQTKTFHKPGIPPVFLSHYPQLVWDQSFRGSWSLYGHLHVNSPERAYVEGVSCGKSLNVNTELHGYRPWSLDEVVAYMAGRPRNPDEVILKAALNTGGSPHGAN